MGEAIWGGEVGMLPRKLKEAPGRETACSEQLRCLYIYRVFFVREGWEKEWKISVRVCLVVTIQTPYGPSNCPTAQG